MWWLASAATSTEARFQALVTLIGGVLAILVVIGGLVWRGLSWIRQQTDATRDNTVKTRELADAVGEMQRSIERLNTRIDQAAPRRRRWL